MNESLPIAEQTVEGLYVVNSTINAKRGEIIPLEPVIYGIINNDKFNNGNISINDTEYNILNGLQIFIEQILPYRANYPVINDYQSKLLFTIDDKNNLKISNNKLLFTLLQAQGSLNVVGVKDSLYLRTQKSISYYLQFVAFYNNPSNTQKYNLSLLGTSTTILYRHYLNFMMNVTIDIS